MSVTAILGNRQRMHEMVDGLIVPLELTSKSSSQQVRNEFRRGERREGEKVFA